MGAGSCHESSNYDDSSEGIWAAPAPRPSYFVNLIEGVGEVPIVFFLTREGCSDGADKFDFSHHFEAKSGCHERRVECGTHRQKFSFGFGEAESGELLKLFSNRDNGADCLRRGAVSEDVNVISVRFGEAGMVFDVEKGDVWVMNDSVEE